MTQVAGEITEMPKSFLITNKRYVTTAVTATTTSNTSVSSNVSSSVSSNVGSSVSNVSSVSNDVSSDVSNDVSGLSVSSPSRRRATADNEEQRVTSSPCDVNDDETGKHRRHNSLSATHCTFNTSH